MLLYTCDVLNMHYVFGYNLVHNLLFYVYLLSYCMIIYTAVRIENILLKWKANFNNLNQSKYWAYRPKF